MVKVVEAIENAVSDNKHFIGTIAFKGEELSLPNGSTAALGVDGEFWVLVYQKEKGSHFVVYEYDSINNSLQIDGKPGRQFDYKEMRKLIDYFFSYARTEDLITILPLGGEYA